MFSNCFAELSVSLNVETPGSLSTMIASSRKSEITHLTLSGTINGSDILYIRNMAGASVNGTLSSSKCSLTYLDISDVTIVEGGAVYAYEHSFYRGENRYSEYSKYTTKNNTITSFMFDNCYKLKTLVLPTSVTKIESNAFFDIDIQSITLPEKLELLECAIPSWYITELKIAESNQYFKIIDGILYSKDMKTLYRCPVNFADNVFNIPEGVENIFQSAFNFCRNIKNFVIPSTVKTFGEESLGWLSLEKFHLDPNITYFSIGYFTNIEEVIIPDSYTEFNPSFFGSTSYDDAEWNSTKVKNVKVQSKTPPTLLSGFNRATLSGNLFVPKGTYSAYYIAYRWGDFSHIYEYGDEEIEDKCSTPTISYSNGKLVFDCDTEGVTYKSSITNSDVTSYQSKEIQLSATYKIKVYAIKDGFKNSDETEATLCWIDQEPESEGLSNEISQIYAKASLIQTNNGKINISGITDGIKISVYDLNGRQIGSTISNHGTATIQTNLPSGTVIIIHIDKKSVKIAL